LFIFFAILATQTVHCG